MNNHQEYFEDKKDEKEKSSVLGSTAGVFIGGMAIIQLIMAVILFVVWIIGGATAFIASIVCMFYNSSIGDKVAGFFLALFFGPFYWFFYIYKASYCNKYPSITNYYVYFS